MQMVMQYVGNLYIDGHYHGRFENRIEYRKILEKARRFSASTVEVHGVIAGRIYSGNKMCVLDAARKVGIC